MSWNHVLLADHIEKIGSGITPRGGDAVYVSSGTVLIRSQNIYNNSFHIDGLVYISEEQAERMRGVTVQSGDVLLNITGDSVARCCIVPDQRLPARVNQHVAIIRPKPEKINPRFLMYFLTSPYMQATMLSLAGSGGTRKALTKGMIEKFRIPRPDIDIQENIVERLSKYDDLIENNRRRIALLEESARLLYREWFVHFRFPGHENVRVIDGVPQGWELQPLIQLAEIVMGQSPKSEFYNMAGTGLPFHQGVTNFGYRFVIHRNFSSIVPRIAESGDILISVRAPVGRLNLTLDRIVIGRGLAAIRSRHNFQSFLFYALKKHFHAEDIIGTGTIYAAINKSELENQLLLRPAASSVYDFERQVGEIDRQIVCLTRQNELLVKARDQLLPRLMNGETMV